jgi:Glycosyltransferase like family
MIVFGTAITSTEQYERFAAPGIASVREPDSQVLSHQSTGSLFRNYNLMLDLAGDQPDLEALVIVHQDTELLDDDHFCSKVRGALADPEVAIAGCVGAIGVRSIAWWEGAVTWASFVHRYTEIGGGDITAMSFSEDTKPLFSETGEVDSIDGVLMVLSPWAVRNLRFDESLGRLHGYDFDICCQAKAAGKKVVTANLRAIHHHSLDLISDPDAWIEAYIRLAEKWDGKLAHEDAGTDDWHAVAIRARAEAACAMGRAQSNEFKYQAALQLLERVEKSPSWRITKPLRAAKRLLRRGD